MPDGAENSSLQTATIEGTREDSLAEAAIDGGSELDEEKNESEIMNVEISGRFVIGRYLTIESDIMPEKRVREKADFYIKCRIYTSRFYREELFRICR